MTDFPDEDADNSKPVVPPISRGQQLDHTPLGFGMWKGKTPSQVAEAGQRGESWLRWAYESLDNPPCSEALYRSCGGKSRSKKEILQAKIAERRYNPAQDETRKVDRHGFDSDLDDDIPF